MAPTTPPPGAPRAPRPRPLFPHRPAARFCYALPVDKRRRYLLRLTFFYGASSRSSPPPDMIVDGTVWTAVNTTDDSLAGSASYYEGVFPARGRNMSFCLSVDPDYTDAGPFINALQVIQLDDSVYNATDFGGSAMGLIARTKFGSTGDAVRYPDDRFDRHWQPSPDSKHAVSSTHNVTLRQMNSGIFLLLMCLIQLWWGNKIHPWCCSGLRCFSRMIAIMLLFILLIHYLGVRGPLMSI